MENSESEIWCLEDTQACEGAAHREQEGYTNGIGFLVLSKLHNNMTIKIRSR